MREVPVARGLFVCENVVIEEGSRNVSIINSFTVRYLGHFPSIPVPLQVFSLLTDGLGIYTVRVQLVRLDTAEEITHWTGKIGFLDKLQFVRYKLRLDQCVIPAPGKYQFQLLVEDESISSTCVDFLPRSKKP